MTYEIFASKFFSRERNVFEISGIAQRCVGHSKKSCRNRRGEDKAAASRRIPKEDAFVPNLDSEDTFKDVVGRLLNFLQNGSTLTVGLSRGNLRHPRI